MPTPEAEQNHKAVLARCTGQDRPLSSAQTTRIVQVVRDLNVIRTRCPIGFAPFAEEVLRRIKPVLQGA